MKPGEIPGLFYCCAKYFSAFGGVELKSDLPPKTVVIGGNEL
jgi:hypothetical protein